MQIRSVGIDLGKTVFHLVALGAAGAVLIRRKFSQRQLLTYTANMPTSLIGLEACSGAHFLGRELRKQGHDVRLIAAQFVKPFVKSNKNDFVDAEAIAEAVERKNMRFVPIKTDDQEKRRQTGQSPEVAFPLSSLEIIASDAKLHPTMPLSNRDSSGHDAASDAVAPHAIGVINPSIPD
jgi:hypothetical protein